MKHSPFNESQEDWIRNNYKKSSAKEISKKYDVKEYQVYNFVMKEKLGKKIRIAKVGFIKKDIFNVDEKVNWAI